MTGQVRIHFDGVWKSYPAYAPHERGVRDMVGRRLPDVIRRREKRWALRDVSFEVHRGEMLGILGHNGAGKSTLLRLASGVGVPTRGRILLSRESASVLSLGYSFDDNLSGRENALTAAVLGGRTPSQARADLPAILEFGELEGFGDAPLRTYSDGMRLRLAFGVISLLQPHSLLLDEVIAVGDIRFQEKCLHRIKEMRSEGTAVVLASHALEQVQEECDRAIWLQGGVIRAMGDAESIGDRYRDAMLDDTTAATPSSGDGDGDGLVLGENRLGSQELTIGQVVVERSAEGSGAVVRFRLERRADVQPVAPHLSVSITKRPEGLLIYDVNTERDGVRLPPIERELEVALEFEDVPLAPGDYTITIGAWDPEWQRAFDYHIDAYPLVVQGPPAGAGVVSLPHRWSLEVPS